jgi:hypothetical protein
MKKVRIMKGWRVFFICAIIIAATALIGSSVAAEFKSSRSLPDPVVVQGIAVEIKDVQYQASTLQVEICFDMPSNADWVPYDLAVLVQGESVSFSQGIRTAYERDENGNLVRRCDRLSAVLAKEQVQGEFTLVLPRLFAYRDEEVPDCAEVHQKLNAAGYDIRIACTPQYSDMGGSWEWKILEKPAGMSDAEANYIVGDVSSLDGVVEGPWTFVVNLP